MSPTTPQHDSISALTSLGVVTPPRATIPASIIVNLESAELSPGATTQATATVLDSAGALIKHRRVRWASSDTNVARIASRGAITAIAVGVSTITATLDHVSGQAVLTVKSPGTPTLAPVIADLSRMVGSSSGGTAVIIAGANFTAGTTVTFGGVASTSVTVTSPTQMRAVAPPHAPGKVDISVSTAGGSASRAGAFEYLQAPTRIYFENTFESNTLSPLVADVNSGGSVVVSNEAAFAGTRSAKTTHTATNGGASGLSFTFGGAAPGNPALSDANGLYLRWYQQVPTTTMSLLQATSPFTAQMKLHLFRQTTGSGQPGWVMCGVGADFPPGRSLTCFIDNGIQTIAGGATGLQLEDGNWLEIQLWYRRTPGAGRARMWVNGRPVLDVTSSAMGNDDAASVYRAMFGGVYVESPNGGTVAYVDNVKGANGYIDQ